MTEQTAKETGEQTAEAAEAAEELPDKAASEATHGATRKPADGGTEGAADPGPGPTAVRDDPIPLFQKTVRPEWIDYNGHMSEAFYVLAFGHATDAMMIETGLGPQYREHSGCSLYTAEAHVRYLSEVEEGAELVIRTRVLGADTRKVRFAHEMYVGEAEGDPVATTELLGVHVDQKANGAKPFPAEIRERFALLVEQTPEWAGRSIGAVPRQG